jgi:DNA repair exonuclease SbcCD nuclease subunit
MTTTKILFIGDPHFQITNLPEVELFTEHITTIATERKPDIIIIAGDLLHTHERLHTTVLNKAYDFVDAMRNITKTYILVGNHDYISNTQYLNDNHWMNSMKKWHNVEIIDRVRHLKVGDESFVFVPYVYVGRFTEALETLGDDSLWKNADCIFAHQEFEGCKMGAIVSVDGDKWNPKHPLVVSGHIHSRQRPQPNVYYCGTPMQHAFGESENNVVPYFEFADGKHVLEEIEMKLPRKKIVYLDVTEIDNYKQTESDDKIRITVSGSYDQFKALKKTKKYKDMLGDGMKIVFRPEKLSEKEIVENVDKSVCDFPTILNTIITKQKNPHLLQAYDLVVNQKNTKAEDVFFL